MFDRATRRTDIIRRKGGQRRPPRECKTCELKFRKSKELRYHNKHNHGSHVVEFKCGDGDKWHMHYSREAYDICNREPYVKKIVTVAVGSGKADRVEMGGAPGGDVRA